MTKHQPATPLPWRVSNSRDGGFRVVQTVAPVAQITKIGNEANAAYIAHAANAYPQLVAALRAALQMYAPFQEQDDSEQGNDHGANFLNASNALLRSLGEIDDRN